jgi:hypothetical protein
MESITRDLCAIPAIGNVTSVNTARRKSTRCIYCLESRPWHDFDKEHVIPKAFGKVRDALTLVARLGAAVCRNCNNTFGSSIDRVLGRDSPEALLRFRHGLKPSIESGNLLFERMTMQLPDYHVLGPLYLTFDPRSQGEPLVIPLPQARFRLKNGTTQCVLERDIDSRGSESRDNLAEKGVSLFWPSYDADAEMRLKDALKRINIDFPNWEAMPAFEDLPAGDILTEVHGTIDSSFARAIAKIAFNYLAWTRRYTQRAFVYTDTFTLVRRFIRYAEGHWRDFVFPSNMPVTHNETRTLRRTQGHLITLDWAPSPGADIVASIALFNDINHRVRLARLPRSIWFDLQSGHHYNLASRSVETLAMGRFVKPPEW